MIKSKSPGMLEAIGVLKEMSLSRNLRCWYETELKLRRDRKAEDDYVREEGKIEGKAEDIIELLEESGKVSEELRKKIFLQQDVGTLRKWLKLAARVQSTAEFEQQIG